MIPNLYRFVNILSAISFLQREKIAIFLRIFPTIPVFARLRAAEKGLTEAVSPSFFWIFMMSAPGQQPQGGSNFMRPIISRASLMKALADTERFFSDTMPMPRVRT